MIRGYLYRKFIEKKKRKKKKTKKNKSARKKKIKKRPKKEMHNVHENPSLFAGIIIGLLGGVLGNLFVLSSQGFMNTLSIGNEFLILAVSLGGFVVVIWFLFSLLRKSMY